MTRDPRPDLVQSDPQSYESRISAIAHALLTRRLNEFRDEMTLFAKREVLCAQIEVLKRFGTFPEVLKLQRELDKVNLEISKLAIAP